jgi:hypothetical protein
MFLKSVQLLVFLAIPALAGDALHRDWTKSPAIVRVETSEEIFAIGDVHGDYDRLLNLLLTAKIVGSRPASPAAVTWTANKSILVFTGDLVDKGPHSLKVLKLISALRDAAANKGGRVVTLMGNHEAEFLADPHASKSKDFAADLTAAGMNPDDVAACRTDVGQFLCSLPFGARVRDWFFSHAGNTDGRTLDRLVSDLQNGVDRDGFASQQLIGDNSLLEARLGGGKAQNGQPWFANSKANAEQTLAAYASALGVAHIVQGHQHEAVKFDDGVQRNVGEMFQRYGLLFLIDTGMSEDIGDSQGAILRIRKDATAICPDGKETKLWDPQLKPATGRAAPCGS